MFAIRQTLQKRHSGTHQMDTIRNRCYKKHRVDVAGYLYITPTKELLQLLAASSR